MSVFQKRPVHVLDSRCSHAHARTKASETARTRTSAHAHTHTQTRRHTDTQTHRHTDAHTEKHRRMHDSLILNVSLERAHSVEQLDGQPCLRFHDHVRVLMPLPPILSSSHPPFLLFFLFLLFLFLLLSLLFLLFLLLLFFPHFLLLLLFPLFLLSTFLSSSLPLLLPLISWAPPFCPLLPSLVVPIFISSHHSLVQGF